MWRTSRHQDNMGAVLLLSVLLLSGGVMSQDDATGAAAASDASAEPSTGAAETAAAPGASEVPPTPAGVTEVVTGAGTATPLGVTVVTNVGGLNAVNPGDRDQTTALAPSDGPTAAPAELETQASLKMVLPVVSCVEEKDIGDSHISVVVKTSACEETKNILELLPAAWCAEEVCRLLVSQDGNKMLVSSHDATSNVAAALQNEDIIKKLGLSDLQASSSSSSGTSVFVGVLLTGLLLSAGLIGGYCLKNRRAAGGDKAVRLAEEAYPVEGENQGNTLVSVAPLNPPPETQQPAETTELPEPDKGSAEITSEVPEKPGANGDAPEEVKTDPPAAPPTNGHSTAAKTADTEL